MQTLDDFNAFASRAANYERRTSGAISGNAADGHRFNLETMHRLLERLGHPERVPGRRVIVAGTHGKGSVCHWLDGLLRAGGERTGRYLSPHLRSVAERVRVDGSPLDEATWLAAARPVRAAFEAEASTGATPTWFELMTALALVAFAQAKLDTAILEVGLGGRLDSTNAVDAELAVITEIDLDHTELLGSTLEEIAIEKAGVLRAGRPAVLQVTSQAALESLRGAAERAGAHPVVVVESDREIRVRVPSLGRHQRRNAALAVAALRSLGLELDDERIARGLLLAGPVPGRCELVRAKSGRRWLLDGGHTAGAISALVDVLREELPGEPVACMFAVSRDKRTRELLEILAPAVDVLVATAFDGPRALPVRELAAIARAAGCADVRLASSVREAVAAIDQEAGDGLRLIAGSFYLIGQVQEAGLLEGR